MAEGDVLIMKRLMRLRASQHLRDLCAETEFNRAQLIQPFFVVEGLQSEEPIPAPAEKKEKGFAHSSTNKTISEIRRQFGNNLCLWVDTCLCSYTTHGHCGVLNEKGINHAATRDELAKSAVAFAEAGADGIIPSDMMDGRVARIRAALDEN